MGDSQKGKNNKDFDIQYELSSLVTKKVLPKKLADRLGQKLIEKNVNLTREQFNFLINKLTSILNNYGQYDKQAKPYSDKKSTPYYETGTQDMQKLVETIEKLEKRIQYLETGENEEDIEVPGSKPPRIVKTDDIKVHEKIKVHRSDDWEVEPLNSIPTDPESIIVIMKWLQYLIDKCGRDNLSNILDYYVDIGWISQDAKINLIEYSHGIKEERKTSEATSSKNITDLPSKDHIQSFIYIQKLKGNQLDKHFIDRIDGELNRITKNLDNYHFK